jgi:hypothetical protein
MAAGVDPLRHLYDLRHTYATFALRAGVSVFAVSGFMGSSIAMIDYHYDHSSATAASTSSRCLTRSRSKERWTLGGRRQRCLHAAHQQASQGPPKAIQEVGGRSVDAATRNRRLTGNRRSRSAGTS